jgi:peptidoglycan/LPS O-acetylase OafA/YrhL
MPQPRGPAQRVFLPLVALCAVLSLVGFVGVAWKVRADWPGSLTLTLFFLIPLVLFGTMLVILLRQRNRRDPEA